MRQRDSEDSDQYLRRIEKYKRKKLKKKKRRKEKGLYGDEESYLEPSTVVNMDIGESRVNSGLAVLRIRRIRGTLMNRKILKGRWKMSLVKKTL